MTGKNYLHSAESIPPRVVCFGEVLWDILPAGPLPGGAPMNVAYHLAQLGTCPALITRIGMDAYGEQLVNMLSASKVITEFFSVDYTHPTGLVHVNTNNHQEVVYDIVFPSAWDFIEWRDELAGLVENAPYFVYGSLTSRSQVSRYTLYKLLERAGTKVLDINLRPPHFHRQHVEELLRKADILKMNLAELELITGWFSRFQTTEDRISLLQEKFGINTVIVTMGGDGAMVNHSGLTYRQGGLTVQVADTIGSGDSFLAGYLHSLLQGAGIEQALEFATATGAFIATHHGACPAYDPSSIHDLISTHRNKFQTIP